MIAYLAIGLLAVFALHSVARWYGAADAQTVKKRARFAVLAAAGIVLTLALLRFGQPIAAAVVSGFLAVSAVVGRLLVFAPIVKWLSAGRSSAVSSRSAQMSVRQAADILGIAPTASREEIKKAHHALMQKLHPDHGGNDYLASQINQAKDVLLKQKGTNS